MSDGSGLQKIDLDKVDWRGSREFFDSLTAALEKLDDKDKSYDFTWVGKHKAIIEAGAPINKTFHPDVDASKNWDTTENLFIEGDNLDALKLLQESYLGKVKMIYIDPPYNTGTDFVYHDIFKASTTAHAVMQLNAEDGGNRKWIMIQLPEETDEKSEAYKAGYKTIPEIARERIRRAGDKIAAEHPDAKVDYGFRTLTIADTNYKDVYKPAGQFQQGDLLASVDNIKEDRTDLDLLYGVLTQSALELNRPISTADIAGATIYKYDYFGEVSGLIACFTSNVPEETIKAIAMLKPLTAVFRDSSFADSQAKVNISEHFRILSPDTKVKVI
jgi:hypothetical protein